MKKFIYLVLIGLIAFNSYAQQTGITYQAIIYDLDGEIIPGYDNQLAPLVEKDICLRFSIYGDGLEYEETVSARTDKFGMVNIVVGNNNQTGGSSPSFTDVYWSSGEKSMKVELNKNGSSCNPYNFEEISYQALTYVPFSHFALNIDENADTIVDLWDVIGDQDERNMYPMDLEGLESTDISSAIRELRVDTGDVTPDNMGTVADNLTDAVLEHEIQIGDVTAENMGTFASNLTNAVFEHEVQIGNEDITSISANDDTIKGALNQLHNELGDVTAENMGTSASDVTNAINEVENEVDVLNEKVNPYQNLNTSAENLSDAINELVNSDLNMQADIDQNEADSDANYFNLTNSLNSFNQDLNNKIGDMNFIGLSSTDISAALRELRSELGDHNTLNLATGYTSLTATSAILEIQSDLGDVTSTNMGTSASTVVGALNEHEIQIGNENITAISSSDDSVKGALNQLHSEIGDASLIPSALGTDLTSAIQNMNNSANTSDQLLTSAANTIGRPDAANSPTVFYSLGTNSTTINQAINELENAVRGSNSNYNLSTSANNLRDAINEHENQVNDIYNKIGNTTASGTNTNANNLGAAVNEVSTSLKSLKAAPTFTGTVNVKLPQTNSQLTPDHRFATFREGNNHILGRIESNNLGEYLNSPFGIWEQVEMAGELALGLAGIGFGAAPTVTAGGGCGGGFGVVCVAVVTTGPSTSTILSNAASAVWEVAKYARYQAEIADAFAGPYRGIVYETGSGDYAEWLIRAIPTEELKAGDVISLINGQISKNISDKTQRVLVISTAPAILGNMPTEGYENLFEKVAFLGQVPVNVIGNVSKGDYLIPSGNNDGFAIGVSKSELKIDDYKNIIGVAWESNSNGIGKVNTSIGLDNNNMNDIIKEQHQKVISLEQRLSKIEELLQINENGEVIASQGSTDFDEIDRDLPEVSEVPKTTEEALESAKDYLNEMVESNPVAQTASIEDLLNPKNGWNLKENMKKIFSSLHQAGVKNGKVDPIMKDLATNDELMDNVLKLLVSYKTEFDMAGLDYEIVQREVK